MFMDEKVLKAEIDKFLPLIESIVCLLPGTVGDDLLKLLQAVDSDEFLTPVVNLINEIHGATK